MEDSAYNELGEDLIGQAGSSGGEDWEVLEGEDIVLEEESAESLRTAGSLNSEGVVYSDSDVERIHSVSDAMGEVFPADVINSWENLSLQERVNYVNEYCVKAGEALGTRPIVVSVEDLWAKYEPGTQGINYGNGFMSVDIRLIADPGKLEKLLDTCTHETRHQLQNDAVQNPEAFQDIPEETLEQWKYEFENYIDGAYDFEGYYNQAIERDARAFAEETVLDLMNKMSKAVEASAMEAESQAVGQAAESAEQTAESAGAVPAPAAGPGLNSGEGEAAAGEHTGNNAAEDLEMEDDMNQLSVF